MSHPPLWSITSHKRKSGSRRTPAPRKRHRVADGHSEYDAMQRESQPTLTQGHATLMISAPAQHLDDVPLLKRALAPRQRGQSLMKRNSTLTQMDFFNTAPPEALDFDDMMIEPAQTTPAPRGPAQVDGTYDIRRKPRRRTDTPKPSAPETARSAAESQEEYRLTKRKRRMQPDPDDIPATLKRTSRRLAKREIPSDPARSHDYFAEALGVSEDIFLNNALEVTDSTKNEVVLPAQVESAFRSSVLPQTPKKNVTVVLSSQSPASLLTGTRRSGRRRYEDPSTPTRTPLTERSVNVPPRVSSQKKTKSRHLTAKAASPKTRVIILKLPKKSARKPPTCVDDSQANVWSLPASSLPIETRRSLPLPSPLIVRSPEDELEIPATSQAQLAESSPPSSQNTSPSFDDLLAAHTAQTAVTRRLVDEADNINLEEGVIVKDFAAVPSSPRLGPDHAGPATPNEILPRNSLFEDEDEQQGCLGESMELGSPVANDTQFNVQVLHKVSSPFSWSKPFTPVKAMAGASRATQPAGDMSNPLFYVNTNDAGSNELESVLSSQSPATIPRLVD
jgi:hypothetical protein